MTLVNLFSHPCPAIVPVYIGKASLLLSGGTNALSLWAISLPLG